MISKGGINKVCKAGPKNVHLGACLVTGDTVDFARGPPSLLEAQVFFLRPLMKLKHAPGANSCSFLPQELFVPMVFDRFKALFKRYAFPSRRCSPC